MCANANNECQNDSGDVLSNFHKHIRPEVRCIRKVCCKPPEVIVSVRVVAYIRASEILNGIQKSPSSQLCLDRFWA
jgi:hypothetical protein